MFYFSGDENPLKARFRNQLETPIKPNEYQFELSDSVLNLNM